MGNMNFKAAAAHVAPVYLDPVASGESLFGNRRGCPKRRIARSVFGELSSRFPRLGSTLPTHSIARTFQALLECYVDGPAIERVRKAASDNGVFVSIGFSERNPASLAGLWNSNVLISDTGEILIHHRKLVATFFEKLVWDPGDGAGLVVANTRIGRIGGLFAGKTLIHSRAIA